MIAESQRLLKEQKEQSPKVLQGWMILVSAASLAIIVFFASALMPMLNFA